MAEVRDTTEGLFLLYGASDFELRDSAENLLILYTENVAGHEVRDTDENLFILYTLPDEPDPPTVDCSFGSSFQPGVLKGQGVCE